MNEAVRVHARRDERASCGYCREEVSVCPGVDVGARGEASPDLRRTSAPPGASCPRCGVLVHAECLSELRGCPTLGCETPTRRFLGAPALSVRPRAHAAPREPEFARRGALVTGTVGHSAPVSAARARPSLRGALRSMAYLLRWVAPTRPQAPFRLSVGPLVGGGLLYVVGGALDAPVTDVGLILLAFAAPLLAYALIGPLANVLLWTSRLGAPDDGPR